MPITPQSILPSRQLPTVATGPITSVGVGSVSVRIRPDLTVAVPTTSGDYAAGQMVTVAFPGGTLSAAQIIGGAAGSAAVVRQVVV